VTNHEAPSDEDERDWAHHYEEASRRRHSKGLRRHRDLRASRPNRNTMFLGILVAVGFIGAILAALVSG